MRRSTTFKSINTDRVLNKLFMTKNFKLPKTRFDNTGNSLGNQGDLIFNHDDNVFYGYTENKWAPLSTITGDGYDSGLIATNQIGDIITNNAASNIINTQYNSITAGNSSVINGMQSSAYGAYSTAGTASVAIGCFTEAATDTNTSNSTAVGYLAVANGSNNTVLGSFSNISSTTSNSIAAGFSTTVGNFTQTSRGVSLGYFTNADGNGSISIGSVAGYNSNDNSQGSFNNSICIGTETFVKNPQSIAIGYLAAVIDKDGGIALGSQAIATTPTGTNPPLAQLGITPRVVQIATNAPIINNGTLAVPTNCAAVIQVHVDGNDYYLPLYPVG